MTKRRHRFPAALLAGLLVFAAITGCDSKPDRQGPTNPLDPENPLTGGNPYALTAKYESGSVKLAWTLVGVPDLQGYTIFRRSPFDAAFARVDTAAATEKSWTDPATVYFATTTYKIAALGADGVEADTTGRGAVTITVPPRLRIDGGATTTAVREVTLAVGAAFVDEMILAEDTLFAGASWQPFDAAPVWTLSNGKGVKTLYLKVRRDGEEPSDSVFASIGTARTNGAIVLAGGAPTTPRATVTAAVSGDQITRLAFSTDSVFTDFDDSVILFDSVTTLSGAEYAWAFDTDLTMKRLWVEFENGFGRDTIAVDSVAPDDLSGATLTLAAGAETASVCTVSLDVLAGAVLMNLSATPDFAPQGWAPYDSSVTWTVGDTAGVYHVYAQFSNDFVNLRESPAVDSVFFDPVPLAVVIGSPADNTYFAEGDSISLSGSVVAASCHEAPDSVFVTVGDSTVSAAIGDPANWSFPWRFTADIAETTAVVVISSVTDNVPSTAADTVTLFLVPAAAK